MHIKYLIGTNLIYFSEINMRNVIDYFVMYLYYIHIIYGKT